MALLATIGTTLEPYRYRGSDYSVRDALWMTGETSAAAQGVGADDDVTLSAFGGLSGTSLFHLTDVWVTAFNYTVGTVYNILYNGTTIAAVAPEAGGNVTAKSTVLNWHLKLGVPGLCATITSTTQTLAMVMSSGSATGSAAILMAKGYYEGT